MAVVVLYEDDSVVVAPDDVVLLEPKWLQFPVFEREAVVESFLVLLLEEVHLQAVLV